MNYHYSGTESYQCPAASDWLWQQNTVIIRSLTKAHSLAGLRLGYAVADPGRIEELRAVQPPWSVNSLAQVAGIAALQPDILSWLTQHMGQLKEHAVNLWDGLLTIGFTVLPSSTHFALVEVEDAPAFRQSLLAHRVLVRDCTSFGLPQHIRIAARLPKENKQLLDKIKLIVSEIS